MSVRVKVRLSLGEIEVEADNVKQAMRELSPYYDVLAETACGRCQSGELALNHRKASGYDYYSLMCRSCGCQLDFGQHQEADTLFPKRKLPDGTWDKQHMGWYHWKDRKPEKEDDDDWT